MNQNPVTEKGDRISMVNSKKKESEGEMMTYNVIREEVPCETEVSNTGYKRFVNLETLVSDILDVCKTITGEIDMIEQAFVKSNNEFRCCAFPGKDFNSGIVPLDTSTITTRTSAILTSVLIDMMENAKTSLGSIDPEDDKYSISSYCIHLIYVGSELVKKIVVTCRLTKKEIDKF